MAHWQWLRVAVAGGTILAVPSLAMAQYGTRVVQQPQQQQQKQELHGKGEFDAAGGGGMKAVLDGQPWLVKFEPKVKVSITGTATAEALVPGMFVKFKGEFDKKGKASAEINDLEIFTPNEKEPIRATAAGAGAFDTPMPTKKGPPPTTPTAYDIAGRISSIKKNTITVSCGNMTVHGDLAADAAITVNVADLSLASPGDKIEVRGWYLKGQEGHGYATDVQLTMANQLAGPKKKGAHPVKSGDKTGAADTAGAGDAKPDKTKKPADAKTGNKAAEIKKPAADKKTDDAKGEGAAAEKTDLSK